MERLVIDRGGYERVLSGSLTMLKEQQQERARGENTWTEKEAVLIPLLEMLLPQSKSRIVVEYDPAEKKVLFIRESRDESGTNQAEKTR